MDRLPYDTGTVVSGAGHVALIGWLVFGGVFSSSPPEMEVQQVSVISAGEFAALLNRAPVPNAATEVAEPAPPPTPEPAPTPDVTEAPTIEAPEPLPPPEPPQDDPLPEIAPEPPQEDVAVLAPDVAETPVPDQAETIAQEPVAEPDVEATPDEQAQEAVTEDGVGETVQEPQDETAPPETTTEIVTEADEPARAPTQSLRPPSNRPTRPTPTPTPTETETQTQTTEVEPQEPEDTTTAVNDALAAALQESVEPPARPSGPPLTGSELEGLRVAVSSCWNVGALSSEAAETKVVVAVSMNENGKPKNETIRLVSSSGGGEAAAKRVFDTARRAIIRCGSAGFPLPVEKFGQWQEIEMTFNPEGMFWR
ncbi:MAG: energy transducer TonB [Aliishimia sp.]